MNFIETSANDEGPLDIAVACDAIVIDGVDDVNIDVGRHWLILQCFHLFLILLF